MLIRRPHCLLLTAAFVFAGVLPQAWAHGDMHDLILAVTKEIEKEPRNPENYLRRAELERFHQLWDAAYADMGRAEALSNQWHILHLARARLFLDAEWFESAKVSADRFLSREPNHAEALAVRARARVKLGDRLGAAEDFSRAITNSPTLGPELFIERAQALTADGNDHLDAALRGLEQGIATLGPLVTLELPALELEVKQNRVDAALARLDKVMAQSPRKESWLLRRGEILRGAGLNQEAAEAFQAALKALDTLPPSRRNVPAMAELEQRIRTALAETDRSGTGRSLTPPK